MINKDMEQELDIFSMAELTMNESDATCSVAYVNEDFTQEENPRMSNVQKTPHTKL